MAITIRTAVCEDLKKIAQVHIKCFPNSLSSQMGGGCLESIIWSI